MKTRKIATLALGASIGLSLGWLGCLGADEARRRIRRQHRARRRATLRRRTSLRRPTRTCPGRMPACWPKCSSASSANMSSPSTIINYCRPPSAAWCPRSIRTPRIWTATSTTTSRSRVRASTPASASRCRMEDGQVVVVAPLDGSPAAAAGIRSGDVIATIDGVPVNTTTLADTIGRMRGKEGTSVKVRNPARGHRPSRSIFTLKRIAGRIAQRQIRDAGAGLWLRAHRRIQRQHRRGHDEALRALRSRNGAPLKGLVLDLRNNPGGVLEAAVAVADAFLDIPASSSAPAAARPNRNSR